MKHSLSFWQVLILLTMCLSLSIQPAQTTTASAEVPAAELGSPSAATHADPALTLNSAYVRDVDLGNGQRAALLSTSPLNYQAEDGSWQPIDPRFQPSQGGFTNPTNLLKIVASERSAALGLESAGQKLAWRAEEVVWLGAAGQEVSLAQPLAASDAARAVLVEDGRALRYDASWTIPGLHEMIASGPGSVEQSLIFAAPPTLPTPQSGEGASLALRATLLLPEGATLFADGTPHEAAFTTAGEVEVRDAQGRSLLTLTAPFAFEQADPTARVAATYTLTPREKATWQVEIRTPWAWWQADEREYPVVLDPYMTVHQTTLAASAYSESGGCSYSETGVFQSGDLYHGSAVSLGRNPQCSGVFRALVRFDTASFPTLPVGAVVEDMELFVAAAGGYFRTFTAPGYTPVRSGAAATVEVRQVLDEWGWTTYGGVQWGSYGFSGVLGSSHTVTVWEPEDDSGFPAHFTLPASLYTTWKNGQNFGLELRLVDETWQCADCGQFVEIPDPPNWSGKDIDTNPANLYPDGGGFMLVINYQAPELQEGVLYGYDEARQLTILLPTDNPDQNAFTEHHYGLPSVTTSWSAVAIKGVRDSGHLRDAGHPRLRINNETAMGLGDGSTYMLLRGDPGTKEMEVLPFGANKAGEFAADGYVAEVLAAIPLNNGNPIQAGQTVTYDFEMSSLEIMRVFDLNLVAGTNVGVQVHYENGDDDLNAKLFPPAEAFQVFPKQALDALDVKRPLQPVESGGSWGLVVEYPGDPETDEIGFPFVIPVTVVVTACNPDQKITDQGCWSPPVPTPAMTCKDPGPYWLRSQSVFVLDPNTSEYYNTSPGVTLGWGSCASAIGTRWVVVTNEVRFKDVSPYALGWHDENDVSLVFYSGGTQVDQWFWHGKSLGNPNPSDADYGYLTPESYLAKEFQYLPVDPTDAKNASIKLNVNLQQVEGQADILREVETRPESQPGVLQTFTFSLEWLLQADVTLSEGSYPIDFVDGPYLAEVGAMELHPENNQWEMDFHPGLGGGRFSLLRTQARIAHSEAMGGAWKPVQAVILPSGEALPGEGTGGNTITCPGNCLDVRHPTLDDFVSPYRTWEFPDIEISGQANMMAFSKPGSLDIFSTDQPNDLDDATVPFSFKTVGGYVSSYRGVCPDDPSKQMVQIIQGSTRMSLPGLGDDANTFMGIQADFTLCQDALHEVSLAYDGVPIPVGSTGLFISGIGGTITLSPENTQVEIDVDYRSGAGGELTTGTAKVTINTAGLFSAQVLNGNLVGIMNYDGYATVTWNPMSFSTGLHGWMDLWILHNEVNLNASIWQGQGWQNQYWWLPDDGATHFAGSFSTRMTIPEGAILSKPWFPNIPWEDWELFSIELAIGEFHCGECSGGYEYGIQGTFSHGIFTLGYDVGLFIGFESGMDVILGGGQHALVNQHPGLNVATRGPGGEPLETLLVGGKPLMLPVALAPDPAAADVTWPLTVTAQTSSMLVGLGWENLAGHPRLTLIRPDAVEITPENAEDYEIHLSTNAHGIFYGIEDPMGENWTAKISNATEEDYWHLIYFANNQTPAFHLLTPDVEGISWHSDWSGDYTIEWEVPEAYENDEYLTVSLYYTKTVSGVITPTTGLIVDKRAFYRGYYDWDLSYLGAGTYQVWGVLRNGGSGDYFDPPGMLDAHQWLGISRAVAPGTLAVSDDSAPPVPTGLHLIPLDEAFLACWNPSSATDIAGYQLTYLWENVNNASYARYLRVAANVGETSPLEQCARIGNLNVGKGTAVMVAAYDTSGNLSANSAYVGAVVENAAGGGPVVSGLDADDQADYSINVTWNHATAAGYRLYYAVDMPAGPQQPFTGATEGPSPILVGATGTVTLHGLPIGQRIHFAIQAVDAVGRPGSLSEGVDLWLSESPLISVEMPADWANAYGLDQASADPDQDCLVNFTKRGFFYGGEFGAGTNPLLPDTDGDGYLDGEEVEADSDPLDPASYPEDLEPAARLSLSTNALMFRAGTEGAAAPAQYVEVLNTGGKPLTPTVSVNVAWLDVAWEGDRLKVTVNSTGLAHGDYTGTITLGGAADVCTLNAPQKIVVVLGVFKGNLFNYELYIPILKRQ